MTTAFAYDTYYIFVFHIFSIFLLLFVNAVIWLKAKKTPLIYSYLIVQGIILLWMVSKLLKTVAPDAGLKFFFVCCQYTGVCFLGEAFFIFAYLYAMKKKPSLKMTVRLTIPSVLFWGIVVTNPLHHLFYTHFDFWGDSFGPAFYFHQGYNYLLLFAGFILCARKFRKQFGNEKTKAALFSIGIMIPIFANIIYIFGWFKFLFGFAPPFDITPVACNLSLMVFALATFRYRFFDALKIARRNAVSAIPEGIAILDGSNRVVDCNNTFRTMLECGVLNGKNDSGFFQKTSCEKEFMHYRRTPFVQNGLKPGDFVYETVDGRFFRTICRPVLLKNKVNGLSVRLIDFTSQQKILADVECRNRELAQMNEKLKEKADLLKKLAIARTRNDIAAEAHDILGHSIVLVISLLEIARFYIENPMQYVCRAEQLLKNCLAQLITSISGKNGQTAERESLLNRLDTLVQGVKPSSVIIDVTCTGNLPMLSKEADDTVYKLCREAITNAMRHGKADHIYIVLRMVHTNLEICIIDNGFGCKMVHKGLGITEMENRLRRLDGLLLFNPMAEQGFCLRAFIPAHSAGV